MDGQRPMRRASGNKPQEIDVAEGDDNSKSPQSHKEGRRAKGTRSKLKVDESTDC